MGDCIFCKIVAGDEPATVLDQWVKAIAIKPLNPVADGHVLIIPRRHVENYMTRPDVSAATMAAAADFAYTHQIGPSNIITSAGREATQSVFHLHLHIVPRAENDGLALPWYSGKRKNGSHIEPELNADWSAHRSCVGGMCECSCHWADRSEEAA